MTNILDYLKAKGVDTDKLTNPVQPEAPAPDVATPVSPEMLGMPPSGPNASKSDGMPNFFQDADTAKSAVPLSPEMLGLSMGGPNSSPYIKPSPVAGPSPASQDDEEDDEDPTSGKVKSSLSIRTRGGADPRVQALQNSLNNKGFTDNTVENLKAAQDQATKDQGLDSIMRAVGNISGGLVGMGKNTKSPDQTDNNKFYDGQDKQALQKVQDFKDRGEQEKNDPKSALSVSARQFAAPLLAKLGMTLPDNVSYAGMEKLNPQLTKLYDASEARDARHEDLALKYSQLAELKKQAQSSKEDLSDTKRLDAGGKAINAGLASSRTGFGKDYGTLMAVQNAKALLDGSGSLDDIDTRQIAEVSRVLDRILSNGTPTISGTEHLTPDTMRMRLAKQLELYTNKRQGAGASDFLQNTSHTLDREEATAKQRMLGTMKQSLSSLKDVAQRHPERFNSMIAENPALAGVIDADSFVKGASLPPKSQNLTTSSGKIKVSNGSETLEIDPSDLEHATKDGYKQVN